MRYQLLVHILKNRSVTACIHESTESMLCIEIIICTFNFMNNIQLMVNSYEFNITLNTLMLQRPNKHEEIFQYYSQQY